MKLDQQKHFRQLTGRYRGSSLTQSELSRTAAVSPPGVEVAVVSTLSTGGALTLGESCVSINLVGKEVERGGQHRSSGHQGAEERLERDHDEGCKTRIDLRTVFVGFDDSTFPSSLVLLIPLLFDTGSRYH